MIKDDQAAGRLFFTFNSGLLYLVWTQNDGRVLGEVAGAPHLDSTTGGTTSITSSRSPARPT